MGRKPRERKLYILADMKNCELTVMVGNADEIAKFLKLNPATISRAWRCGGKLRSRYKLFEYEGDDDE